MSSLYLFASRLSLIAAGCCLALSLVSMTHARADDPTCPETCAP